MTATSRAPPPRSSTRSSAVRQERISGVLLVVVGLYVGYHGIYELRLYLGDGPASDPVVDAAGQVQGIPAGWVDRIGPLPLLLVLAVLLGGAVLFTRSRRRHSHTPR